MSLVLTEIKFPDPTQIVADWFPHVGAEVAVSHEATYPSQKALYGASLDGRIEQGQALGGIDLEQILLRRLAFTGAVRRMFRKVELLLLRFRASLRPA